VVPWDGTRRARAFGPGCPQKLGTEGLYRREDFPRSEDCLYLNVWTGGLGAEERRPVMVWIHGGAFVFGDASNPTYDGASLARKGVVVVTLNYRLGALGFLAHPALSAESEHGVSGNYGILDQMAALRWVRKNVAAFGGDPDRVTVFGQSAGAMSVAYLQAAALSAGLFHRSIGQSGSCLESHRFLDRPGPTRSTELSAHGVGLRLAEALDIRGEGPRAAEELRSVPPDRLLEVQVQVPLGIPIGVVDGWVFPEQMATTFAEGRQNAVPTLTGFNADEDVPIFSGIRELSEDAYQERVRRRVGPLADAFLAAYREDARESRARALGRMMADGIFGRAARAWARWTAGSGSDAWLYYFDHAAPLPGHGRSLGAFHAAEVPYVFDNLHLLDRDWSEEDRALARRISARWVAFAREGEPVVPGDIDWPRYDPETDRALRIGARDRVVSGVLRAKLDLLDRMLTPT